MGNAQDFTDLVNFWNLRASNISLCFYDADHAERLNPAKEEYLTRLRSRPRTSRQLESHIGLWSKPQKNPLDKSLHDSDLIRCFVDADTWNGLNVKPPVMAFSQKRILGAVDDSKGRPSVSFTLNAKQYFDALALL